MKQTTDLVEAKGKGYLLNYWLASMLRSSAKSDKNGSYSNISAVEDAKFVEVGLKPKVSSADQKLQRLISWNPYELGRLIKKIIARRNAAAKLGRIRIHSNQVLEFTRQVRGMTILDEVKEIIHHFFGVRQIVISA
jgi:hypothetical protein